MSKSNNYPREIFSNIKSGKNGIRTMSVTEALAYDTGKPFCHAGYSRFVVTLIAKQGNNKTVVTSNIPAEDVRGIVANANLEMQACNIEKVITKLQAPKQAVKSEAEQKLLQALNHVPKLGVIKDKPLIESASNRDILLNQRNFLAQNLDKFPANKTEIDFLDTVLRATPEEIAKAQSTVSKMEKEMAPKCLYDSGHKPLRSKSDGEGNYLCYQIKINYLATDNYPFQILIENCYCPVSQRETGQLNTILSQAKDTKTVQMRLSQLEGLTFIAKMKAVLEHYESVFFAHQYNEAQKINSENAAAAKAAKTQNPTN